MARAAATGPSRLAVPSVLDFGMLRLNEKNCVCLASDPQWLEERTKYVSGSDIAALLGLSPWKSREALVAEFHTPKVWKDTQNMWWGREMEGPNMAAYGKLTGLVVTPHAALYARGPIGATTDAVILPDALDGLLEASAGYVATSAATYWAKHHTLLSRCIEVGRTLGRDLPILVEMKNTGERNRKDWANKAPPYYEAQVQAQLFVTELDTAVLVAKVGSADIRAVVVEADTLMHDEMVSESEKFLKEVRGDT